MESLFVNMIIIFFVLAIIAAAIWPLRKNLKKNFKGTLIVTMALLIFSITIFTVIKTYWDYKNFLANIASHELIMSNIAFAVFLDFSILIIGGLFLYLANQLYICDFI